MVGVIWPLPADLVGLLDGFAAIVGLLELLRVCHEYLRGWTSPPSKTLCLTAWYWAWRDVSAWAAFMAVLILASGLIEVWLEEEGKR